MEQEKEMRVTAEFDIQKLRLEIQDLVSKNQSERVKHERAMKDLQY